MGRYGGGGGPTGGAPSRGGGVHGPTNDARGRPRGGDARTGIQTANGTSFGVVRFNDDGRTAHVGQVKATGGGSGVHGVVKGD